MNQKFIMLISGRSGSSYLRSLINQDDRALMLGEMLTGKDKSEQQKIIQNFWLGQVGNKNKLAIGFKTKLGDIIDQDLFFQQLHLHNPIIIINRRKNYVKQAISRARMLILLDQTTKKYGQGHHSPKHQTDIVGKIHVDVDWVYRFTQDFATRDQQLANLSDKVADATTIFYEDFAHNPAIATSKLSKILGMELDVADFNTTLKNTPADLTKAIANFAELEARLANTKYSPMLYSA